MSKKPISKSSTRRPKAASGIKATHAKKPATSKQTVKKSKRRTTGIKPSKAGGKPVPSPKATRSAKKPAKKSHRAVRKVAHKRESIESAFRFCPSCRSENADPGSIPFRCSSCDFAFFFGPVAAVGGLIVDDEGRLLMVRRARDPGKGKWGLPGGFVDRGESVSDALAREVYEETNLKLVAETLLTTEPNVYTYQGVTAPVIDMFYVCRIAKDAEVRLAKDELSEYRWCVPSQKELKSFAFESNRKAVVFWLAQNRPASSSKTSKSSKGKSKSASKRASKGKS